MLQRHLRFRILNFRDRPVRLPAFCLSGLALSHMIPPEEITDTQIGVAIWLLLWWIPSSFAGSLVTMGLYQHADWWNLVQYSGPRTPLPHIREYPVRRRKNPQKPPLSDEKHRPNDIYAAEWKMSRMGVYHTTTFTTGILQRYAAPSLPPATLCSISVTSGQLNAQDAVLTPREKPVSLVQHPAPRRHTYEHRDGQSTRRWSRRPRTP